MAALEDCISTVISAPMPSCVGSTSDPWPCGRLSCPASPANACCSRAMPMNSRPKPASAVPMAPLRRPSPVRRNSAPRPASGIASSSTLNLQADERDDPARHRGADVGPEQHPQRGAERQQAGVGESDRRHGDRAGRLHQRCHQHPRPQRMGARPRRAGQDAVQGRAGGQFQAIGHQAHAEQEQAQPAGHRAERLQVDHAKTQAATAVITRMQTIFSTRPQRIMVACGTCSVA